MAGEWIKMRSALATDPKVLAIGKAISLDPSFSRWLTCGEHDNIVTSDSALRHLVTGALHTVWCAANEHATDELIRGASIDWIDAACGIRGFGQAMADVGWVLECCDGLILPKFLSHNTTGAERQRRYRDKKRGHTVTDVTSRVTSPNITRYAPEKRRVEKRREDLKDKTAAAPLDTHFEEFWKVFPLGRKHGKEAARKAWKQALKRGAAPEQIVAAAAEYAASPVGQGEFVKGPAPWLNQGCWEDDRAAWQRKDKPVYNPFDPENFRVEDIVK